MIFGVDFDNTIVQETPDWEPPFKFMPGALEGIRALKRAGHHVIIHSARSSDPDRRRHLAMVKFLDDEGVPYDDVWDKPGKPRCDFYLDDHGMHFDRRGVDGYNWPMMIQIFGEAT